MTHDEFLKKLYDLKDEEQSAKEDYLTLLKNQRKAKMTWNILKKQIKKHRENYYKSKINT